MSSRQSASISSLKGLICLFFLLSSISLRAQNTTAREKILLNEGWHFKKYSAQEKPDSLIYDIRPEVTDNRDDKAADSKPTEAVELKAAHQILKPWILPTANAFIKDPAKWLLDQKEGLHLVEKFW